MSCRLYLQSFIGREIQVLQIGISVPVPIIRPIRDIVLQGITADIKDGQSVHIAQLSR